MHIIITIAWAYTCARARRNKEIKVIYAYTRIRVHARIYKVARSSRANNGDFVKFQFGRRVLTSSLALPLALVRARQLNQFPVAAPPYSLEKVFFFLSFARTHIHTRARLSDSRASFIHIHAPIESDARM